jgi:DNA polymerase III subunit epsilon
MTPERSHQTEKLPSGEDRCVICGRTFKKGVWGDCAGVPQYQWGNAPKDLYTASQLKAMGLMPGPASGALYYSKAPDGWLWLYRKEDAIAKPPLSEKQRAALDKMQAAALAARTCKRCNRTQGTKRDLHSGHCRQCNMVLWAAGILEKDFVVLDTETTGLDSDDEIIAISVIDQHGNALIDTYIKPQNPIEESSKAYYINGIGNAMVEAAPSFSDVYPRLIEVTRGKLIIAYNAEFDSSMVRWHVKRYKLPPLEAVDWDCLMEAYAEFYGDWSRRYRDYRYQSLSSACDDMKVRHNAPHQAAGDCFATLELLRALAAWMPTFNQDENVMVQGDISSGKSVTLQRDTFNQDESK